MKGLSEKSFYTEIDGEQKLVMEIDTEQTQKFIEKIIRGIYFYHKEKTVEGIIQSFSVNFTNPTVNYEALADYLLEGLTPEMMTEGVYSNPDVFRYRYYDIPEHSVLIIILNFYSGAEFIGWVIPEILKN